MLNKCKKDAEGFDNVYGTEHLSKICVEQREIDINETNFIIWSILYKSWIHL